MNHLRNKISNGMKVLMFSSDPTILDWQSPACQRMREYGELFDRLDIFLLIRRGGINTDISERVRVMVFGGRIKRFFSAFRASYKIVKHENIAIITTQEVEHSLIGYALKILLGTRWQMQIHTDIFSKYFISESFLNWMRMRLAKFLIPRADCIRVVSERIKHSINGQFPKNKLSIVNLPIFVDAERLAKLLPSANLHGKYREFDFIILMVSRLTREKNIGLAIEAMAEIVKKEPKTGLVIVGDGPELDKLKARSERVKVGDNVKFEGWADDLVSYYKSADLYLLTSNYEGYGRTVIEALACNLPVVMTDVGVAGEVVIDRNNGIIVPVGEFLGLSIEILKLVQDKKAYAELKEKSHLPAPMPPKEEYLRRFEESLERC